MARPGIVRADTIDLQDHDAPSAQDHSHIIKAPASAPDTLSSSTSTDHSSLHLATHQAETLRGVAAKTAHDRRISWTGSNLSDLNIYGSDLADDIANTLKLSQSLQDPENEASDMSSHQDIAPAGAQSSSLSMEAGDEHLDEADEEELDDEAMDKISSSPSIEDGGYPANPSITLIPLPPPIVRFGAYAASRQVDGVPRSAQTGGSLPVLRSCGSARPTQSFSNQQLFSAPVNTCPLQVFEDSQACKAPDVFPDRLYLQQHRRHHGKYSSIDLDATKNKASLEYDTNYEIEKNDKNCDSFQGTGDSSDNSTIIQETDIIDDADTVSGRLEALGTLGTDLCSTETALAACGHWGVGEDLLDEMTVPYYMNDDEDDENYESDTDDGDVGENDVADMTNTHGTDSRFVAHGWGSESLHNIEDIDFDFVYALHTFMATVEGQANATKGDTMVLLDDSNSYWWLVRVVKDSSLGYLPAEHIETPTERLARLNKHRNIDLSASMLGDQTEKTKNPLKSAMRRRKTKTVSFAPPTYVDSSDIDYSTEEEDLEAEYFAQQRQAQQQQQQVESKEAARDSSAGREANGEQDDTAKVEPLKTRTPKESGTSGSATNVADNNDDGVASKDLTRPSEDVSVASKSETPGPKKTKDGTVRDSFFKDDTVETKKITLTPNLLRDDSTLRTSSDSKEVKQRPSFDTLDKDLNSTLVKDDKKKKDKKQGGFRSLFSRKDKKRSENEDDESLGKRSMDIGSESTERDFDEVDEELAQEKASPASSAAVSVPQGPQKQPSKLQKQQPPSRAAEADVLPAGEPADSSTARVGSDSTAVQMPDAEGEPVSDTSRSQIGSLKAVSPIIAGPKMTFAPSSGNEPAPQATRPQSAAQTAVDAALDGSDLSEKNAIPSTQLKAVATGEEQDQLKAEQDSLAQQQQQMGSKSVSGSERLSEEHFSRTSPRVSPVNADDPPALVADTLSQEGEETRSSPISTSSAEMMESANRRGSILHHAQDSITTSTSATTANTVTWNDASLRAFFDSGTDVRDLLVVVYDKNDIVPAGPDHPVVSSLFKEQNAKLAEITSQLDNMLGDWLARKQRVRVTT